MTRVRNAPDASALMATARSFGNYDLAAALADLIDNSITAQARTIDIRCDYSDDRACTVRIRDDGCGMTRDDLVRAMRPASTHPNDARAPNDLGRFGWGLKSASLSQCKILTVVSRAAGQTTAARWNLDNIHNWEMDLYAGEEAQAFLDSPLPEASGTELIWTNCDRLSENGGVSRDQFSELIYDAQRRLSLTFHRYLTGDGGKIPRLTIRVNGSALEGVDPFCQAHPATIAYPEEPIEIQANGATHRIAMHAFVLPHYSKLTAREYEEFGGEEGYVRNQGFYVYRNRRLIISGTWFGLARHGELSKLVRVRIDIPNSLDDIWKITVDKSDAQLPSGLKIRMKELVGRFRHTSLKVHRSKGPKIGTDETTQVWERRSRNGVIRYSLNHGHPLLEALHGELGEEQAELLTAFLKMAETQIPVDAISREIASDPDVVQRSFISREELVRFLNATLPSLMRRAGSPQGLLSLLRNTEPFCSNWNVTEAEIRSMFPNA